jgi:hypothetical protein
LTARPVSKEASAVTIVTPALGRAMLFRLPSVELRYPLTLGDLGPGTCRDCTFVARLAGESLRVFTPLADLPPSVPVAVVWLEDSRFWVHGGVDLHRCGTWGR